MNPFSEIFWGDRYTAAMKCFTNDTVIAALYLVADSIIALALIVVTLQMWKNRATGFYLLSYQCKLSIAIAGLMALGYVVEMVTIFEGVYRVEVLIRGAIAGIIAVFAFSFYVSKEECRK